MELSVIRLTILKELLALRQIDEYGDTPKSKSFR
jgi:hypothetical protein